MGKFGTKMKVDRKSDESPPQKIKGFWVVKKTTQGKEWAISTSEKSTGKKTDVKRSQNP